MATQWQEGDLLWAPSLARAERARLTDYAVWLRQRRGRSFTEYEALWRWSVETPGAFWHSIWDYFGVRAHQAPEAPVAGSLEMPGTRWFPGATLNYAEHALAGADEHLALIHWDEEGERGRMTRRELAGAVARARAGLMALGVRRGDRVAAFLPNGPEALIAFLATASLGAVWSSCSPEFGVPAVLDRFTQIEPKVLVVTDGYVHGGRRFDRREAALEIAAALPSLEALVTVDRLGGAFDAPSDGPRLMSWEALLARTQPLTFEAVPFDHPLWILYSSGTTGLPKAIVQGHGGILLEHLKALALHCDLGPDDRFFWFTTTGWMMWNFLIGGLLLRCPIVLYEGSPGFPDLGALWRMAEAARLTYFGTSAPFLLSCRKQGLVPREEADLSRLRGIGSTGAPLPAEGFGWVYEAVSSDLLLGSVSGGTDVCTAFVLSAPWLPVHAGEIQCRGLGCDVQAFDPEGRPVVGQVGELVLTRPIPSMPVAFWNDPGGERLRAAYFETFPGVWRHGDWVKFTERGSCVIYGRSDSTLNRGGVRMGTSEFYRVLDALPEVVDALVIDTGGLDREGALYLFVVLAEGARLDAGLEDRIRRHLRARLSPRHVPDAIHAVDEVPYTLSGKKLEVPVKRILAGTPPERAASRDTLRNPEALDAFVALLERLR